MKKKGMVFILFLIGVFLSCKNTPTTPSTPLKALPNIASFTVSSTTIYWKDSVTFSWSTNKADSCIISPVVGDVPTSGTITVSLTESATFVLTAKNEHGAVTESVSVTVKAHAIFVLVGYTTGMTSYKCPVIYGTVRNDGNITGYNVGIDWYAYNSANVIIDRAMGFPAGLGNIPVGVSANFDAVFFSLSSWGEISKLTYEIDWLDQRTGLIMRQRQDIWLK